MAGRYLHTPLHVNVLMIHAACHCFSSINFDIHHDADIIVLLRVLFNCGMLRSQLLQCGLQFVHLLLTLFKDVATTAFIA